MLAALSHELSPRSSHITLDRDALGALDRGGQAVARSSLVWCTCDNKTYVHRTMVLLLGVDVVIAVGFAVKPQIPRAMCLYVSRHSNKLLLCLYVLC